MAIVHWLFVSSLSLVSNTDSAPPHDASPYALEGQLQVEGQERTNGRFSVRARLFPAGLPTQEEGGRFVLTAQLQSKAAAACPVGDDLFANGFESP